MADLPDLRWQPFRERLLQWNYCGHVLRNEDELLRARRYIDENPLQWSLDRENPQAGEFNDRLPWETFWVRVIAGKP